MISHGPEKRHLTGLIEVQAPFSSPRTGASTTTRTGHTARTAGSAPRRSPRPGGPPTSYSSHSGWTSKRGPVSIPGPHWQDTWLCGLWAFQTVAQLPLDRRNVLDRAVEPVLLGWLGARDVRGRHRPWSEAGAEPDHVCNRRGARFAHYDMRH